MRKTMIFALACGLAVACTGQEEGNNLAGGNTVTAGEEGAQQRRTIGDSLAASIDHSSFMAALQSAGLADTLRGAGPYTVFAPTNAAWEAIPEDARQRLATPEQRDRLITLLSYHIVMGTVTAEDLGRAIERGQSGRAELATVTGDNLGLARDGEAIVVSDGAGGRARITGADQVHSNGVVHSIDAVLMPGGE